MLNRNERFFGEFTPRELFTEYILSLMKKNENFMVFPDNKQVLIEEEVDEYLQIHGFLNPTPRLMFHLLCDGYVVNYTHAITNVLVPFEEISMDYEDFIRQVEEDMKWRTA